MNLEDNNINDDIKELISIIDFMAKWINEVGDRNYNSAESYIKKRTLKMLNKYNDLKKNNSLNKN